MHLNILSINPKEKHNPANPQPDFEIIEANGSGPGEIVAFFLFPPSDR